MERKLEVAQESIGDHQQTIVKFRDLVAKLQVWIFILNKSNNWNVVVWNKEWKESFHLLLW